MSSTVRPISESTLKTDLNDLAHSLVRELAMAAKKVSIYGKAHPVSEKAVAKPFVFLSQIFHYRRFVTLYLSKGNLHLMNIRLKESVFNEQVIQLMQMQDVVSILVDAAITSDEFTTFVDRFVRRLPPTHPDYRLADFLKRSHITSIEVDTERSADLFENRRQYRGDLTGEFTVKRFVLDLLPDDIQALGRCLAADQDQLIAQEIDFYPPVVAYIVPEKIAALPVDSLRRQLTEWAGRLREAGEKGETDGIDAFLAVMKILSGHPQRTALLADIDTATLKTLGGSTEPTEPTSETGKIKIASRQHVQEVLDQIFTPGGHTTETPRFLDAFERLLKTGQHDQAVNTIDYLLDRLTDSNPDFRQRSLELLSSAVSSISSATNSAVLDQAVSLTLQRLNAREETYEFSELLYVLFSKCLLDHRFDLLARLAEGMATRRQIRESVVIYDSMAVKKALENINRSDAVQLLVTELMRANHDQAEALKKAMVAIGSEEIALALSEIIAHPIRQIRQLCLRILSEMGKATLRVFSQILVDDSWFERSEDRRELPDQQWYVVRNSIFVLGLLHDPEAIVSLRLRLNDKDARVRREIVSALEKIGGDEAIDLLGLMAEDAEREIAESAVIAIGLIGTEEAVPLLNDILRRNPAVVLRYVHALGKIGGEEAGEALSALLLADDRLADLAGGRIAKDDLRVAIIKALGAVGTDRAKTTLTEFQQSLSVTQKLLFKNSPVQKALSDLTSKK